jgi:hypothetical protein
MAKNNPTVAFSPSTTQADQLTLQIPTPPPKQHHPITANATHNGLSR